MLINYLKSVNKLIPRSVHTNQLSKYSRPLQGQLISQIRPYSADKQLDPTIDLTPNSNVKNLYVSLKATQPWNRGEKISSTQVIQPKLEVKNMLDSYLQLLLPFETDSLLLGQYENYFGLLRVGKIMEDLDTLACAIVYKHCNILDVEKSPYFLVTASVDRLDLAKELEVKRNYRIYGHVSYVGFSSAEVILKIEPYEAGEEDNHPSLISEESKRPYNVLATFTIVAIDKFNSKPSQINPLKVESDVEKKLMKLGEISKDKKKQLKQMTLTKSPPTSQERLIIHDLYLEALKYENSKPSNVKYMRETQIDSSIMCNPQNRNIYGFMFGGFLMRESFELAWINAYTFCKDIPIFLGADEIVFRQSVPVGSILKLTSQVTYSDGHPENVFQVAVEARVIAPDLNDLGITNTFHYTFKSSSKEVPKVIPRSYAESMAMIEGKRRKAARDHIASMYDIIG